MDYANLHHEIESALQLKEGIIALAFVENPPDGVKSFDEDIPSACTLWRRAETETFYASADKHYNCPVGAMVMGFELPEDIQQELQTLVQKMCGSQYLDPEEAAKIPAVAGKKSGAVYGPLKNFPIEPQIILIWLTAPQAMLYSEAVGSCNWTESVPTTALGRPGCAVIPTALSKADHALTFGCIGLRTYTEIDESKLLAAFPFSQAGTFLKNLDTAKVANERMLAYYQDHKAEFTD